MKKTFCGCNTKNLLGYALLAVAVLILVCCLPTWVFLCGLAAGIIFCAFKLL